MLCNCYSHKVLHERFGFFAGRKGWCAAIVLCLCFLKKRSRERAWGALSDIFSAEKFSFVSWWLVGLASRVGHGSGVQSPELYIYPLDLSICGSYCSRREKSVWLCKVLNFSNTTVFSFRRRRRRAPRRTRCFILTTILLPEEKGSFAGRLCWIYRFHYCIFFRISRIIHYVSMHACLHTSTIMLLACILTVCIRACMCLSIHACKRDHIIHSSSGYVICEVVLFQARKVSLFILWPSYLKPS